MSESKIVELKTIDELNQFIEDKNTINVLDASASWCLPCKKLQIELERLLHDNKFPNVKIAKINIDLKVFNDFCDKENISSIPHVIIYQNGNKVDTVKGFTPNKIESILNKFK